MNIMHKMTEELDRPETETEARRMNYAFFFMLGLVVGGVVTWFVYG